MIQQAGEPSVEPAVGADETPSSSEVGRNNGSPSRGNYLRYGIVLGAILATRPLELLFAGLLSESAWWLYGLSVVSMFAAYFTVTASRKHFPIPMVILLAALAGGVVTLVVSSIPGMIFGAVVGVLTAIPVVNRYSKWAARHVMLTVVPGALVGLSIGFAGSLSTVIRVPAEQRLAVSLVIACVMAVIAWLLTRLFQRWRPVQSVSRFWLSYLLLFFSGMIAVPFGIQFDTDRRIRTLNGLELYVWDDRPAEYSLPQFLTCGFTDVVSLRLEKKLTGGQAQYFAAFHDIHSLYSAYSDSYRGEVEPLDGFAELSLRNLAFMTLQRGRIEDDELLALAESHGIQHLNLRGNPGITDRSLSVFKAMDRLSYIDLSETGVQGDGLKHLNPAAPLSHLFLARTGVTDEALDAIPNFQMLQYLDLAETRVTGKYLWKRQLPDQMLPGLATLVLSDSDFDERYIDEIPAVSQLYLDGIPLSEDAIESLVCRYLGTGGLFTLSICRTGIPDRAALLLKDLEISELNIDATNLTDKVCPAFLTVEKLQLSYDWEPWQQAGGTAEQLVEHYQQIRRELSFLRRRSAVNDPRIPPNPEVSVLIRDVDVTSENVRAIASLRDCRLLDATVNGEELLQKDFDADEMHRYFHEELREVDE